MAEPVIIATRGSALALAQANAVLASFRKAFPVLIFELKIIKTTGDKLQTASMSKTDPSLPKGLFTKELEVALLRSKADVAVHSLKDLPTELPDGLVLTAVAGQRADVRDVLIYRADPGLRPGMKLADFPAGFTVATSSTRRQAQLLVLRPDFKAVEIRGNVATRLRKLAGEPGVNATILAAAGLGRLHFEITDDGRIQGESVPDGLLAVFLDVAQMLPCPGQGAIGLEIRAEDGRMVELCRSLDHYDTCQCVRAERALLQAMGGGCRTPLGACAEVEGDNIHLRAVSFLTGQARRAEGKGPTAQAVELGQAVARSLMAG